MAEARVVRLIERIRAHCEQNGHPAPCEGRPQPALAALCDELLQVYQDRLLNYIRYGDRGGVNARFALIRSRQGGVVQAEDVLQEVALKAYRSICQFREGQDPWPWLKQVARSVLQDEVRRSADRIKKQLYDAARASFLQQHGPALRDQILVQGQSRAEGECCWGRICRDLESSSYQQFQTLRYEEPGADRALRRTQDALAQHCLPLMARAVSYDGLAEATGWEPGSGEEDAVDQLVVQQGLAVRALGAAFALCKPHQALMFFWKALGYQPKEIVELFSGLTLAELAGQLREAGMARFEVWQDEFERASRTLLDRLDERLPDGRALGERLLCECWGKDPEGDIQNWYRRVARKVREHLKPSFPDDALGNGR